MLKKILTSALSIFLILSILSGCSIDKDRVEDLAFILQNTLYCLANPYSEFIEDYNNKISPSENNQFSAPEDVSFKRLPLEQRMGYNSLADNEKELYSLLEEAADNLDNLVELKGLKVYHEDFNRIFDCLRTDCPDIFYLYNGFNYLKYDLDQYADIFILFYTDGEKYDKLNDNWEMETEASRETIANQMTSLYNRVQYHLGLTPDDSDKNRVKYIYELIVTNTEYDNEFSEIVNKYNEKINSNALKENEEDKEDFSEEELSVLYKYQSTAYGALCYKNAICGGYTAAIGLLLNEKGIVNGVCYGLRENKYYHIWNIVKIGNNYFHLDSTNEKPLDGKSPDWMVYEYFLCSDSVMRKNYEFLSTAYTAPACNDKSLYIYNKTTCKITAARDFSFELYQSLVTEAVKADVHVITFVASYPISTMAVSSIYYEYYNKTFFVNGIAPKLSTTYYHSPDYKTVNFYISY